MECLDFELATRFADRLLSGAEEIQVQAHVDTCASCRVLLSDAVRGALSASRADLPAMPPPPEPTLGSKLGRYVLLSRLGAGSMGVVFAAYDPELDRNVALKVLHTGVGDADAERRRGRFLEEAHALARLAHPNVVAVHDVGWEDGHGFIAMELVKGGTLRQWLRERPRSWRQVCATLHAAATGVAAAHAAGITHRDLKPDNILIGPDGRPRVTDFGLARLTSIPASAARSESSDPNASSEALVPGGGCCQGVLIGTPGYMAPEQLEGQPADGRSDQFSFCVVLYEALVGRRPFTGITRSALLENIHTAVVEVPRRIPRRLARLLQKGLSPAPERRFASMDELLVELARDPGKRRVQAALALTFIAVLGLFSIWLSTLWYTPAVCTELTDNQNGVWSDSIRSGIDSALRATGAPEIDRIAKRALSDLQVYADEWLAARTESCRSRFVPRLPEREIADARADCVAQNGLVLQDTVDLLAKADARSAGNAVLIVHALPSVKDCRDTTALLAPVRPPADPALRTRLRALNRRVAELSGLLASSKLKEALQFGERLSVEVSELAYPPLTARVLRLLGQVQEQNGAYELAAETLRRAMVAAEAGRSAEIALGAATTRAWVVGYRLGRRAEGLQWLELADAKRAGSGIQDENAAAIELTRSALAGMSHEGNEEAVASARRGLALIESARGSTDFTAATYHLVLGAGLENQRDFAAARSEYEQALSIALASVSDRHPMVLATRHNLGNVLFELGEVDAALAIFQITLVTGEAVFGGEHPMLLPILDNVGRALTQRGRGREALPYLDRSITLREKLFGSADPLLIYPLELKGQALLASGDARAALAPLERARVIGERGASNEMDLEYVRTLSSLGEAKLLLDQVAAAVQSLERAQALLLRLDAKEIRGREHLLGRAQFLLARAYARQGTRGDRIRHLADEARSNYANGWVATRDKAREVEAWLAAQAY